MATKIHYDGSHDSYMQVYLACIGLALRTEKTHEGLVIEYLNEYSEWEELIKPGGVMLVGGSNLVYRNNITVYYP